MWCGVVGVWQSIRMEVSTGFFVVVVCNEGQCFGLCKVRGGMASIGVTRGY